MPEARKRPCTICRRWFRPDPRVGDRQHACGKPECQTDAPAEDPSQLARSEPRLRHRLADRPAGGADPTSAGTAAGTGSVEPTSLGRSRKTSSARKALISLRLWEHYWSAPRKTSSGRILLIPRDFPAHFPGCRKRPVPASAILNPEQATMQLEFHQLDRRWEHLRVREPHRQRRLLASLAESGQQTPIVVVVSKDHRDRYLVIDGYKRIAALQQLGRDTVEATVWAMSEAEALLLSTVAAIQPAGKRAGTRLAVVGDGATLRLLAGRTGAPFRPQRELGVAAAGAGRVAAGGDPAASTRRQNLSAGGDEVSGAGGARQMRSTASAWPPHSSSTVATRGKPGNSIPPGAKARAWFASAFSPNRNCF